MTKSRDSAAARDAVSRPQEKGRRRTRQLVFAALVVLGVCGYLAISRMLAIAAVQNALERDWEINFNDGGRPRILPARIDAAVNSLIYRLTTPGREPLFLGEKPNRDNVWRARFRGLFRGRITSMEIYYPGRLRGDLGAVFARFPALRRLTIEEAGFSDSDWAYVFAGLHRLKHLEELGIGSYELRDSTIRPLANHPISASWSSPRESSVPIRSRFSAACRNSPSSVSASTTDMRSMSLRVPRSSRCSATLCQT